MSSRRARRETARSAGNLCQPNRDINKMKISATVFDILLLFFIDIYSHFLQLTLIKKFRRSIFENRTSKDFFLLHFGQLKFWNSSSRLKRSKKTTILGFISTEDFSLFWDSRRFLIFFRLFERGIFTRFWILCFIFTKNSLLWRKGDNRSSERCYVRSALSFIAYLESRSA